MRDVNKIAVIEIDPVHYAVHDYDELVAGPLVTLRTYRLAFVTDPHTGPLHLPVRELLAAGLPVALGQDDIEDAYYPFGRHNMLEVAFLAAHLLGFRSGPDQLRLLDMIIGQGAVALGLNGHAIAEGNAANLCIHGRSRVVDLLREHAAPRFVIRDGRVIARTETTTELILQ